MAAITSSPDRSADSSGPIAGKRMPKLVRTARSMSAADATPASSSAIASRTTACCIRVPRKPSTSRCSTTGTLPMARTSAVASSTRAGAVRSPPATSTIGIRCAGFQKCSATTRSGWRERRRDVGHAQAGGVRSRATRRATTTSSSAVSTACLTATSSLTASTTTPASEASARSVVPRMRPVTSAAAGPSPCVGEEPGHRAGAVERVADAPVGASGQDHAGARRGEGDGDPGRHRAGAGDGDLRQLAHATPIRSRTLARCASLRRTTSAASRRRHASYSARCSSCITPYDDASRNR